MALNPSLILRGRTASFTRGLPRREIWTHSPELADEPALSTEVFWRLEVAHTPATALGDPSPETGWPSAVSWVTGICSAMVCTFLPLSALTPPPALPGS